MQFTYGLEDLPVYTRQQLALRNGQDREEVWIALDGLIYNVRVQTVCGFAAPTMNTGADRI